MGAQDKGDTHLPPVTYVGGELKLDRDLQIPLSLTY
jgi:hypothetical protein